MKKNKNLLLINWPPYTNNFKIRNILTLASNKNNQHMYVLYLKISGYSTHIFLPLNQTNQQINKT